LFCELADKKRKKIIEIPNAGHQLIFDNPGVLAGALIKNTIFYA